MDIGTYGTSQPYVNGTEDAVDNVALEHMGDLQITGISPINTGGGEGRGGLVDNRTNLA